jgi:hypothetical protein
MSATPIPVSLDRARLQGLRAEWAVTAGSQETAALTELYNKWWPTAAEVCIEAAKRGKSKVEIQLPGSWDRSKWHRFISIVERKNNTLSFTQVTKTTKTRDERDPYEEHIWGVCISWDNHFDPY